MAKGLMLLGTHSNAGKSLMATAFCRLFARQGCRVAPFKAQNMSNNAGVTPEGGEMGRAQIVQAEAAGILPHTDMNPILLKPQADYRSQIILDGKVYGQLGKPHAIVLPGTKATLSDLAWLKSQGLDRAILNAEKQGTRVVGICGGYQILGRELIDDLGVESVGATSADGLNLLSVVTHFAPEKQTHQVYLERADGTVLKGYEIHVGDSQLDEGVDPFGVITQRGDKTVHVLDGAVRGDKNVWGTYLHGVFDNDDFREQWLTLLGWQRGDGACDLLPDYDRLADAVEEAIDGDLLAKILNL